MNLALLIALSLTQPLAARIGATEYTVTEDQVFVLKSVVQIPEGYTVVSTFWLLPETLDYHQRGEEVFGTGEPGKYKARQLVTAAKIVQDDKGVPRLESRQYSEVYTITITEVRPRPPPKPQPPTPSPTKAPFPSPNGLAFLILYEASETGLLPVEQASVFSSSRVLKFGNQYAVNVNGDRFFRILDDDYSDGDLVNLPPHVREAYQAVKPSSLPWIAIANGDKGYSGPLPKDVDSTLELLGRFR